jgi:hypothetical protein
LGAYIDIRQFWGHIYSNVSQRVEISFPMPLSDAYILALPAKDKPYKYFLGEGLHVYVLPNGSKYWRIKHRFNGRERIYSTGVFPKISAAVAFKAAKHVQGLARRL